VITPFLQRLRKMKMMEGYTRGKIRLVYHSVDVE
jgi:hypothetical protein